jgi:hypothetical protein
MTMTHWPLTGLRLRTPRLELRLPALADLDELAGLAAEGLHDPGAPRRSQPRQPKSRPIAGRQVLMS